MSLTAKLDRTALALAAAGCLLAFFAERDSLALYVSLFSLPISFWQIAQRPRRIFYILGFAILGVAVLLLEGPLSPQIGKIWVPLVIFSFQLRLVLLEMAEKKEGVNQEFARELKATVPANSRLFIDNDIETDTPTSSLHPDHIVRVQAGEILPADGVVSFGSGFTEELLLTGDPEPAAKGVGKNVYAGSRNKSASFLFRVSHAGNQTFLQRKANFLQIGFSEFPLLSIRYFLLEILALLFLVSMHAAIEDSGAVLLGVWLSSLGALYAGSSWALQLALVARSAATGVLWRSLADVRSVSAAQSLVTDPEGSLMEGVLRLSGVATDDALAEEGALRLAAPLARRIESPAAYSILKELRLRNIPLELLDVFFPAPGGGAGVVSGEEVRFCDESTLVTEGIPYVKFSSFLAQEMKRPGASAHFLLRDSKVVAAFSFVDSVRASSAAAVQSLARAGLPVVLLSQVHKESLQALAQEVGVEHFQGEAAAGAAEELLSRLGSEGLAPLWLDNGITPLPPGKFPKIVTPFAKSRGEVTTARWDLASVWHVIRLGRAYQGYARRQFLQAVILQAVLAGVCVRWPLAGVAGAPLLAFPLLFSPVGKLADDPLP